MKPNWGARGSGLSNARTSEVTPEGSPEGQATPEDGNSSSRLIRELAAALDAQADAATRLDRLKGRKVRKADRAIASRSPEDEAAALYASIDEEDIDEPPVPIPSTWITRPEVVERTFVRRQLRAAAFGFGLGLMVVIPIVLALTGQLGFPGPFGDHHIALHSGGLTQALTTPPLTEHSGGEATLAASVSPAPASSPATSDVDVVSIARQAAKLGDVVKAQAMLLDARGRGLKEASFALAETYDPIMLAAWGLRGAKADVVRSRELYAEALAQGDERAAQRLQALK